MEDLESSMEDLESSIEDLESSMEDEESSDSSTTSDDDSDSKLSEYDLTDAIRIEIPPSPKKYSSLSLEMVYSPSGRYAALIEDPGFNPYGRNQYKSKVLIADLVSRKILKSIKTMSQVKYWYWLSESEITIVTLNSPKGRFVQFVYCCNFEEPLLEPRLIKSLATRVERHSSIQFYTWGASKISLHGHDFLLAKMFGGDFVLLPYNLITSSPVLPFLRLNVSAYQHPLYQGKYVTSNANVISYENILYFWLWDSDRSHFIMDHFLKIEVTDFDLQERNALCELDPADSTIIAPRKLNDGLYIVNKESNYYGHEPCLFYMQNGPLVLLILPIGDRTMERNAWILNLKEETIYVKIIPPSCFGCPSLYGNMFLFHKDKNNELMLCFNGMTCEFPKLKDLCKMVLLSLKTVNQQFEKHYEKLTRF